VYRDAEHATTGGWIEITLRGTGELVKGELISVDASSLHVLTGSQQPMKGWVLRRFRRVFLSEVDEAKLYAYDVGDEVGRWAGAGAGISSITLIGPLFWGAAALYGHLHQQAHRTVSYPGDGLRELAIWARFPQGMPRGLTLQQLLPRSIAPAAHRRRPLSPPGMTAPIPPPVKPRPGAESR
jgi:hypothetical protein